MNTASQDDAELQAFQARWREAERRSLEVACPFCKADAGDECRTKTTGVVRIAHGARVDVFPGRPAWPHGFAKSGPNCDEVGVDQCGVAPMPANPRPGSTMLIATAECCAKWGPT